ncbi:MAG: hypothetical protein ACREV5_09830 [Steroidobacter sp.]
MQFRRIIFVAACIACLPIEPAFGIEGQPESHPNADNPAEWRNLALQRAFAMASSVDDPYRRAEVLASIARTQASTGDESAVNRTIHQALAAAAQVREVAFRGWVLHDIMQAQIAAEDLYGARETASRIEADRPHGAALAFLANLQLRGGDLDAAQATARKIRDVGAQGEALRQIVAVEAARGEVNAARSVLPLIKDSFYQRLARGDVVVEEVRAGNIDRAYELAERARRRDRAEIYGRIALARVEASDLRGAAETLQKIDDILHRAVVQGRIAAAHAQAGEKDVAARLFVSAIGSVEGAESAERKALILAQIARLQASAGDRTAARETLRRARVLANRMATGEERDDTVDYIARGQARAGDAAGALDSALQLNDRVARALLVRDVVTLQRDATSTSASASAAAFDDPLIEAAAQFGVLGVQLLRTAQPLSHDAIEIARAAVRRIDDRQLRPAAFSALAAARLRSGDVEASGAIFREALAAAESLERPEQRAAALVRIATALDDRLIFLGQPADAAADKAENKDVRSP